MLDHLDISQPITIGQNQQEADEYGSVVDFDEGFSTGHLRSPWPNQEN